MNRYLPFQFDHGSADSSIWNLPSGALVRLGRGDVNDVAFTPDGRYLAVTSHFGLWWYDVSTRAVLTLWEAGTSPISCCNFQLWDMGCHRRRSCASHRHLGNFKWDVLGNAYSRKKRAD